MGTLREEPEQDSLARQRKKKETSSVYDCTVEDVE